MEKYAQLLKSKKLKVTPQRLHILKYLDERRTHPTVHDIYTELKEKHPHLSKTTVYNAVETLKEHNLIQSLSISGSETHYEIKKNMHHHFVCKKCGRILDINIECPNIHKVSVEGHIVNEVQGYFIGICKYCNHSEE